MRVLLVVHQFLPEKYGGTEQLTRHTGLELMRRGHEVHVLTGGGGKQEKDSLGVPCTDYEFEGLKVHAVGKPRYGSPVQRIRAEYADDTMAEHVRRYVEELEPEVVHVFNLFNLSGSPLEVFREWDLPVVFTPTSFWPMCKTMTLTKVTGELCSGPDELTSNCLECWGAEKHVEGEKPEGEEKPEFYRKLARRALSEPDHFPEVWTMLQRNPYLRKRFNSLVDVILSPNEFMSRVLVENGIDPGRIRLSPYGIEIRGLEDARGPRPPSGEIRVGFIGSINRLKGVHVLVEAFKELPEGATLRLCGGLEGWPDYAREVYELAGGDSRINFAGPYPNEEVAAELGRMNVLVVPSVWYENTPVVVYEAFAAGVPVVGSDVGGIGAVVRHGENGLLFEPGNVGELAARLRRLMEEPGLLERLGNGALGEVRSLEDSVDEMLETYGNLLEGKRRSKGGAGAGL